MTFEEIRELGSTSRARRIDVLTRSVKYFHETPNDAADRVKFVYTVFGKADLQAKRQSILRFALVENYSR